MKYFSIHIKSQMQYKTSFFLTLSAQFLISFTELIGLYFMFHRFETVEDFTYAQALLCYAVVLTAFSVSQTFMRGFDMFPRMLGNGAFDRVMVRPRSAVFQIIASQMEFTRLGRLLQAVTILCYALPRSGVFWSADKIAVLCLMIICGCLIFSGLFLLYAALSFFTVEGLEFMNVLTDGGAIFGKYPFSIYGKGVLRFLTFIVPLALVQYYPLLYLLGRETGVFYICAPLCSLIFLLPCCICYRFGLRRYKSTGS